MCVYVCVCEHLFKCMLKPEVNVMFCLNTTNLIFEVHWAKMDAEKLVKEGPSKGKEHRHPEKYYDSVLKGARLVAEECAKDVIFE